MKILIASTPAAGHLNPMLAIARLVRSRGDDVVVATGTAFAKAVAAAGARFVPLEGLADFDAEHVEDAFPGRSALPPGPDQLRYDFERAFLDTMRPQAELLRRLVDEEAPAAILVDSFFFGATALFLDGARARPPILSCGVTIMTLDRDDGAPAMLGLPPARSDEERERYRQIAGQAHALFAGPVQDYADARLGEMGLTPLPVSLLHSRQTMADAFLQLTVPEFEYGFSDMPSTVRFVGALPAPSVDRPRPTWWAEVEQKRRRVVLVTQGTVANHDLGELIAPTLEALAGRDDVLVVATTGNRPLEAVPGPIPANARIETFLDFGALLPHVDAVVTNGGYGTVSLALKAGVPVVAAGRTEDKAEVGARVAWSGVGIEIPTQRPEVGDLREALVQVLDDPRYRARAGEMARAFARFDTPRLILEAIDGAVRANAIPAPASAAA